MDFSIAKIAIIGLGYVGLPLAVEFDKQRAVLGFDISIARVFEFLSSRDGELEVAPQDLAAFRHPPRSSNAAHLKACGNQSCPRAVFMP